MKAKFFFYNVFSLSKILLILIAGILNGYGIYLLIKTKPNWEFYIQASIVILGFVLLISLLAGYLKKSIIKNSVKSFLKNMNMEEAEILRINENAVLVKHDQPKITEVNETTKIVQKQEEFYTVEFQLFHNSIGLILLPAHAKWDTYFINKNGEFTQSTIEYKPLWEVPNWKESRKQAKPLSNPSVVDNTAENENAQTEKEEQAENHS